ncbi:uncharacterized protein LOC103928367 [Pyrus x bretschneideri]|uniref:uncharacterized protein LOC103928367 n=1 Tax=Pyrus x bretschneideri TaxID=225117 RepID=UPI00202F248D|nr:uncharacterized protein LOC103928367 [Pyrus x bretschneideri]XP_048433070.1 uncharacterized protein LOC103928367 [Pyrus x bretschneideri]
MECNKEEAFKAMQLSEVKMRNSDFTGARKMAQKAQRLFPGIENIEKLLTVCEVHCSSENKIGFEMDWYGILQIQKSDDDVTIKKQYRKLALLLHPDKNKFAGAEAAFKLIGEANRVLTDQAKRSTYDMKCRAQLKTGSSIPSAHPSNGNLFVRKQNDTPQSQFPPDTFWTCCPFCKIKYQYFKDFANRLLRCQKCRRAFVAQDLGIQSQGAHPESVGNQFPNRKEPPSQGTSNAAPQSNGGTGKPSSTRFHYGKATSNPSSKAGIATDVKISQSGPVKSPVKSKDSKTSGNMNKKRGRESSESCKPSELNEGHHHRRSSRIKQNLSYNENLKDDDDFVSLPKRSTDSQFSSDTEMERKNAAADVGVSKNNSQPGCATTAAVGGHKKEAKQKVNAPLEECLPSKRSKTAEFEQKVEEAAMPDKDDDKSKADNGSGPNSNVTSTSIPAGVLVPDPEFNKFMLDVDTLENVFSANQTWALYDPLDGLPRFYARIKKVFSPGFKLRFTWLEPSPDDQREVAWCNKELPVACGKYTLGATEEVTDHLMFSHQMHCIKGSGRSSFFVYPKKGETWALYQNWDIGWSSEPEKHLPYKFDFVEVLSDFVENYGVGVAYLGKVKGFVSLFQRREQHGVVMFQVLPNELYRFSHRIPSFKMTGTEREGVPEGSFEFDPAALPTNSDDLIASKTDNRTMNTEANGSSCDISESKTKPVMSSGKACPAEKQEKNYSERETSTRRSPRMSNGKFANSVRLEATQGITEDNGTNQGNQTQPRGSSTPRETDESNNTPKKHQKNDSDGKSFSLRRSPRDVSKNIPRPNVTVKCPDSANDTSHASFTPMKVNSTSSQAHSSVRDHPSVSSLKIPVAPSSSSPLHILSRSQFYDFDGQKSEDKFRLDQIWALYSDKNGMPRTYAQVKKIVLKPKFQLHVALLEPCLPEDTTEPVCCGTFKVKSGQTMVVSRPSFSHCVKAKPIGKTMFEIYPRKGEVWALYKNSGKSECEMVQVLEDNEESTKVAVLPHVNGSKSLFRAPRIHRSKNGIIDIPRAELGRFSHQVPAFLHTGEIDIQLASCWEVDQLSIPGTITIVFS